MGLFVAVSSSPAADQQQQQQQQQQQTSTPTSGHSSIKITSRPLLVVVLVYMVVVSCLLQQHQQVAGSRIWRELRARREAPLEAPLEATLEATTTTTTTTATHKPAAAKRLYLGDNYPDDTEDWLDDPVDFKFAKLQDILDQDCGRVPLLTNYLAWPGRGSCDKPTIKPTRPPAGKRLDGGVPVTPPSSRSNSDRPANETAARRRREKRFANTKLVDFGMFPMLVEVRSGFETASGSAYWTNLCNGVIVGKNEVITETVCIRHGSGSGSGTPIVAINMYRTPDTRSARSPPRNIYLRRPYKICVSERWRKSFEDGYRYPDDRFAVLHFEDQFHWNDYTQTACLPWGKYRHLQSGYSHLASYGLDGNFKVSSDQLDGEHWLRMTAMGPLHDCSKVIKSDRPAVKYFANSTTLRCAQVDHTKPHGWGYFCDDGTVSDAGAPLLTMVDNRVVLKAIAVASRYIGKTPVCNPNEGQLAKKLGPTVVNDIFESMSMGELYDALTCMEDNLYKPRPTTNTTRAASP